MVTYVTKQLAAASANNICLAQNPGTGAFTLNGSTVATAGAITSFGAITAGTGGVPGIYTNVALTGGSGTTARGTITVGASGGVTSVVINPNSPGINYVAADSLSASSANIGGCSTFSVLVGAVTPAIAKLDTQRRLLFTPGGSDAGVSYVVAGADDSGTLIGESVAGVASGTVATLLDYAQVFSIKGTGSVANGITVGTNGVGASPWFELHWPAEPFNVEVGGTVVAGKTVNWGWQYTYDNPWKMPAGQTIPQPFNHPTVNGQASGSLDGPINNGVAAVRLIVNSGTDAVRGWITQSGVLAQ